jgi:hypothetical protein
MSARAAAQSGVAALLSRYTGKTNDASRFLFIAYYNWEKPNELLIAIL